MKKEKILTVVIVIAMVAITIATLSGGETYIDKIARERAEKDIYMKTNKESPIKGDDRANFKSLKYYPPDENFIVTAKLTQSPNPSTISLDTNDGLKKTYTEFGYAEFEINGHTHTVTLFEMEAPYSDRLFLPFSDLTSADETYGAGRYLEIDKTTESLVIIDFNLAYNPYCAYSDGYSCPFPPRENMLEVAIPVGEKFFK